MADNRTKIDELIEESYLATLPDEAIRKDLLQFLETCGKHVKESEESRRRQDLLERLGNFKELALRIDQSGELPDDNEQWSALSTHDLMAHRAARLKLRTIETIRAVDGALAEQIEHRRFPKGSAPRETAVAVLPRRTRTARRSRLSPETTMAILRVSYALMAGATFFIIGFRLFR